MADIFEIVGKFAIKGADKAKKDIDDITGAGEKSSSKLGKVMGGMGKLASTAGKAVGAGLLAGGTAIVALGKQAVSAYGEYEQLVGGVETLFKESADTVIKNSANAYKTAGMSANEYMSTVTSFSASLLQSLGGDTVEAAAYADRAITDMSDNANKMGTSMEMIQNAYNGFAKQNYTMLDNLKLGYGGTKTEMERLIADASQMTDIQKELGVTVDSSSMSFGNIVNAISVMQKSLGITGTTAQEASSTIQGSIASMKGAWTNLLTGLSDDTQNLDLLINNFIESVGTVGSNLLPRLEVVFKGIAKLISTLAPELINQINTILPTVLPIIIDGATQIVNAITQSLPGIIDAIIAITPQLIDGIMQITDTLIGALPQILQSILSALPALIPQLIDGSVSLVLMLVEMFPQIIQPIIDNLPIIIMSIVDGLTSNLPILIGGLITLVLALVTALPQIIQGFVDAIPTVISKIVEALITCVPQLIAGVAQVILGVAIALPGLISSLAQGIVVPFLGIFSGLWTSVKNVLSNVISSLVNFATNFTTKAKEAGTNFVNNLVNFVKTLPGKIQTWLTNTIGKVTTFATNMATKAKDAGTKFINNIINTIKELPSKVQTLLTNAINRVTTFATNMANKAKQAGTNFVNNLVSALRALPGNIAGFFSTVISNLASFVSQMIAKAIEAGQGFVTNIMGALNALPGQVVSIGTQVVTGIWNGISGGMGWLLGQLQSWCGSVINAIKGWFGIHSPSRVMRDEVGRPIVEGIAVGIKENSGEVSEEFQKMLDDLQLQRDLDIINEGDYYTSLEKLRNKYLEKGTADWWQYTKDIIEYENKAFDDLNNDYADHLNKRKELTSNFYDKISAYDLYDYHGFKDENGTTSWYTLKAWDSELEALDVFENRLMSVQERLKTVFAGDNESLQPILDIIRDNAFSEEGNKIIDMMLNSTDAEFEKFANGYRQFMEKTKRITNNVYADDLAELDNSFIQNISEKFANSPLLEQIKDFGANLSESLIDGINSKGEWLKEQIIKFCNSVSQTFDVGFGVGDNLQLSGVNEVGTIRNYQIDYTNQLNNINDAIDRLISLIGEYLPGISQKMDRPIVVDGNSLAVGMARKMDSQLGKLTVAKGRGNV